MNQECCSLDIKNIRVLLENQRKSSEPLDNQLKNKLIKKAAILIPFVCVNGCWNLLFTRRSDTLKNHRGQVSFPGGGMEKIDKTPEETALREAYEEIGLKKSGIHIIGNMPDFITISDYIVTPIVSWVDWPVPLELSKNEVSRVFTIPIVWLRDKNNWEERIYSHPSGWYGSVIFYNLYDGELLWGISAKITLELLNILGEQFYS
ncbi:MAG: CoA pyrophosphatase [Anaerolineaceae bacterium]|nr:CoA pyrophosphatase [Anaerolineaceae bacterium]